MNEIIVDILRTKNFNFIATATTPWHAIGINANILYLNSRGVELKGFIFIFNHSITGKCINRNTFGATYKNIEFIEIEYNEQNMILKALNHIKAFLNIVFLNGKNEKIIYVLNPTYPDFNWINIIKKSVGSINIKFVTIDEGVGSFLLLSNKSWISTKEGNEKTIIKTMKLYLLAYLRQISRSVIFKILKKKNNYINNNLLVTENMIIVPNSEILPFYKHYFTQCTEDNSYDEISCFENSVVINTQCLSEDLKIKNQEDIELLELVFEVLAKRDDNVILKPHPREKNINKYSKFPCTISPLIKNSQELIFAHLRAKPKCIIGLYTSSLITANLFFDIPAISLAKIFLKYEISDSLKSIIRSYIHLYDKILLFPENQTELEQMMDNIDKKEKISVVLASFNGEKYIYDQLYSIYNQSHKADEVIISDDGSVDNTCMIVKNFIMEHELDDWKLIHNVNKGVVNNFCNCFEHASGDIIFLCDQDDVWEREKIESMVEVFKRNKKVKCVNSSFTYINNNNDIIPIKKRRKYSNNNLIRKKYDQNSLNKVTLKLVVNKNISPGMTMAVRKDVLNKYLIFSKRNMLHDWEINCFSALEDGLYFYNRSLSKYRIHADQAVSINNIKRKNIASVLYQKKKNMYMELLNQKKVIEAMIESINKEGKQVSYLYELYKLIELRQKVISNKKLRLFPKEIITMLKFKIKFGNIDLRYLFVDLFICIFGGKNE